MAIDSLYKADMLSDLIGKIAADMGSEKFQNKKEYNNALLELIGGASVASFLDIGDTPNNYIGSRGFFLRVNNTEDGIEFFDIQTVSGSFLTEVHVDATLTGDGTLGNPLHAVSSGATFTSLSDTPNSFSGAGKILQINATNDAIEFVTSPSASNIYVADGLLTGNRLVQGTGYDLTFNNIHKLTLQSAGAGVKIGDSIGLGKMSIYDKIVLTASTSTTNLTLDADITLNTLGGFNITTDQNIYLITNSGWFNIPSNADPDGDINTPINGVLSYDTTDKQFRGYIDGSWIDIATGPTLYNKDGVVGTSRSVTITDSILWEGTSKYKYISGANTIETGIGLSPAGLSLVGNLTLLTTAAAKTDGWEGLSVTTGSHPQGAGHSEWRSEIYKGANISGIYSGPLSSNETYVSLYSSSDNGITKKGLQVDTSGEKLLSQSVAMTPTNISGTIGIVFVETGGYLRTATLADLAVKLPITLNQVLYNGNKSNGFNIDMGTDLLQFGNTLQATPSISASGADLKISGGTSNYNIVMSAGASGTDLRFHGKGGSNLGVLRLSKTDGSTYTTLDVSQTVNRNISLPDNDGVIALMSDIPIVTGNGIYDGSGALSMATVVTLSAINSIKWSGGLSQFKGADAIHATLAILVTNSNNVNLFEITNGGSLKGNTPVHHQDGAHSFRSGNAVSNVTNGSAFSLEAVNNTVLFDISASGAHRMLGTLSISDSTLKAQISVITNSSQTAGVFTNVGASATGYAIHAIAEDNVAIVAETNGSGASNTSIYASSNVVIGGTQPVGGASGTSRLQVVGSSTGTEWGIETKDGSGVRGFSINNDGVGVARNYTVATVPPSIAGGIIYVTNESGGATLAYGTGTTWKRIYDNATIS